jgi:hypothetical protein
MPALVKRRRGNMQVNNKVFLCGESDLSTIARDSVLSPIDCFRFRPAVVAPLSAIDGPGASNCADDVFGTYVREQAKLN